MQVVEIPNTLNQTDPALKPALLLSGGGPKRHGVWAEEIHDGGNYGLVEGVPQQHLDPVEADLPGLPVPDPLNNPERDPDLPAHDDQAGRNHDQSGLHLPEKDNQRAGKANVSE